MNACTSGATRRVTPSVSSSSGGNGMVPVAHRVAGRRVDVEARHLGLLGRHVLGGPDDRRELREHRLLRELCARRLGDAEVDHLRDGDAVVQRDEDVGGFDVAVDDALVVRVLDRLADLREELQPAAEADAPSPVSNYGHSKLAGEEAVRNGAKGEWVIIRPPAVYGPRDTEFLRLFRAVKARLLPEVGHGLPLSLVYAGDLAATTIAALTSPGLAGRVLYAAHPEIVTAGQFGACIARRLGVRAWRIPLPVPLLWSSCLAQEVFARLTGRPSVLNLQKFAELRAPGWVCEPSPVWRDIGVECTTGLEEGVEETLAWYLREGWL